jgi:hypothetical protein
MPMQSDGTPWFARRTFSQSDRRAGNAGYVPHPGPFAREDDIAVTLLQPLHADDGLRLPMPVSR